MSTYNKIYLTFVMSFTLIGCGGGGGGGSTSAPQETAEETPLEIEETVEIEAADEEVVETVVATTRTMEDLIIPDGFSFDPVTEMNIDIDISNLSTQRAYVSIYSEYDTTESGLLAPSGDHKLAGQSLENGLGNIDIVYADGVEKVLAEIWFYDGSDPIQKEISPQDNTFYY
ncbi:hypothetical protein RCJ22_19965, partial [Vibrio sp. FNV 38]|nr:hypothetical protein [Vibrio sp. FNV 38]